MIKGLRKSILKARANYRRALSQAMEQSTPLEQLLSIQHHAYHCYLDICALKDEAIVDDDCTFEHVEDLVFLKHRYSDLLHAIDEISEGVAYD